MSSNSWGLTRRERLVPCNFRSRTRADGWKGYQVPNNQSWWEKPQEYLPTSPLKACKQRLDTASQRWPTGDTRVNWQIGSRVCWVPTLPGILIHYLILLWNTPEEMTNRWSSAFRGEIWFLANSFSATISVYKFYEKMLVLSHFYAFGVDWRWQKWYSAVRATLVLTPHCHQTARRQPWSSVLLPVSVENRRINRQSLCTSGHCDSIFVFCYQWGIANNRGLASMA